MSQPNTLREYFAELVKEGNKALDSEDFIVIAKNGNETTGASNVGVVTYGELLLGNIYKFFERVAEKDMDLAIAGLLGLGDSVYDIANQIIPDDEKAKEVMPLVINRLNEEHKFTDEFVLMTENVGLVKNVSPRELMAIIFTTLDGIVEDDEKMRKEFVKLLNVAIDKFSNN